MNTRSTQPKTRDFLSETPRRNGGTRRRPAFVIRQVVHRQGFLLVVMLAVLQVSSASLWASPKSAEDATNAVKGWLIMDSKPLGKALGQRITGTQTFFNKDEEPLYRVVRLDPSGFVVVSADDLIEPIIGFTSEGTYDPSPNDPLEALVTSDLAERAASAKQLQPKLGLAKGAHPQLAATQDRWQYLEHLADNSDTEPATKGRNSISDVRVSPFLKTKWNQQGVCFDLLPCYDYYTPQNYACGCAAIAMAQLMRYYQHPQAGVGAGCFIVTVDGISQSCCLRGGDGWGGPYLWDRMVLEPDCGTTVEQRQAIGALCYDASVACSTSYALGEGGSSTAAKAKNALLRTFKYSYAVDGARQTYSGRGDIGSGLASMINPNLDAGLPVILGIRGSSGHGILADGYGFNLGTMYHHLNMGWSGRCDIWYNLPTVDTTCGYSYSSVIDCVYNVFTSGSGEIISGRVTDDTGKPIAGATVRAEGLGGPYEDVTDDNGIYAFPKVASQSTFAIRVMKQGFEFEPQVATAKMGRSVDDQPTSGNAWGVDFRGSGPCSGCGGGDEYITHVVLGTIRNTGTGADGYTDYTSSISTEVRVGQSYDITVANGNPYSSDQCGAWIDWNQDGDFMDAGETVYMSGTPGKGPYGATITVPQTAKVGQTRMRVRITYTGALSPCGNTEYGEVEDYGIIIVPGECFPSCHKDYAEWLAVGRPDCWCYPRQCHGDADGNKQGSEKTGYYYAGLDDLNILLRAWLVKEPPHGSGIASISNGICADFDHAAGGSPKTGFYRVGPSDLNILLANWLVKEPPYGPGVKPDCLDCAMR